MKGRRGPRQRDEAAPPAPREGVDRGGCPAMLQAICATSRHPRHAYHACPEPYDRPPALPCRSFSNPEAARNTSKYLDVPIGVCATNPIGDLRRRVRRRVKWSSGRASKRLHLMRRLRRRPERAGDVQCANGLSRSGTIMLDASGLVVGRGSVWSEADERSECKPHERNTVATGGVARSASWHGGGSEAGGGVAERSRGQAGTAARLAGRHVRGLCERQRALLACWRGSCPAEGCL